MLLTFTLFSFKEKNKEDGLGYINNFFDSIKQKALDVFFAVGLDNSNQFTITAKFEDQADWQKIVENFEASEEFVDLVSSLEKPPKMYEFKIID